MKKFKQHSAYQHHQVFIRVLIRVLENLFGVAVYCYMDDIVIYNENYTEHLELLRQVFEKLSQAQLSLKQDKCSILKSEIETPKTIIVK